MEIEFTVYHKDKGYISAKGVGKFADAWGIGSERLSDLISGKRDRYHDFFRNEECYEVWLKDQTKYTLYNPEEGYVSFPSIGEFTRPRGLQYANIERLLNYEQSTSQGWFRTEEDHLTWMKEHECTLYHPVKGYVTFYDMYAFADSIGSGCGAVWHVVRGKKPSCKGYYKNKETYEKETEKKNNQTSQYPGVGLIKKTGRWSATFYDGNKQIHVGNYTTELEAHIEREKARAKYMLETRGVA
jgi:hypothetical protein